MGGFRFVYHVIAGAFGHAVPQGVMTNCSEPWVRQYLDSGEARHDPLVAWAQKHLVAFGWEDVPDEVRGGGGRSLVAEAARHGIGNGLTIPIHGPQSAFAVMSIMVGGKRGGGRLARQRDALQMQAIRFHERAAPLFMELASAKGGTRLRLTPRERECLEWVALGKSTWEIASILGVESSAVTFHIENAKRKLNVANRTHAVVVAVVRGLITVP